MQSVGERLKTLRVEKGWKQRHLAARADLSQTVVCLIERGRLIPTDDELRAIAEAFQIEISELKQQEKTKSLSDLDSKKKPRAATRGG